MSSSSIRVRVARCLDDMMKVTAIRVAVYMTEQDCPYEEEFDGNDFCATHIIGEVGGEPAACIRLRFFGGFAKMERVAVRSEFRSTRIAFKTIRAAIEHCRRKGFTTIYGHARNELIPLWKMFGFEIPSSSRTFVFSNQTYTEMLLERPLPNNALNLDSDPFQLIRPEGEWDSKGILEHGAQGARVECSSKIAQSSQVTRALGTR